MITASILKVLKQKSDNSKYWLSDYIISSQYLVHVGDKYCIRSVFLDLNTGIVLSQSSCY